MTFDEYSVDLLFKERQAVHARLAELHGRGMAVVQSMILIIGTGVLAATQEPGAFVIAPIIWSVWLLYAQQIDRESMKYSVYGEWLEKQHDDRDRPGPRERDLGQAAHGLLDRLDQRLFEF